MKKFGERMTKDEKQNYVNKKKVYNYIEKEITEQSAQVVVTNNQNKYEYVSVTEFDLVKVNGKWLIEKIISKQ
jgi:molybdopterin-guanine dinucleotide biosynthesis protein A